jgi:hypothetical protein
MMTPLWRARSLISRVGGVDLAKNVIQVHALDGVGLRVEQ